MLIRTLLALLAAFILLAGVPARAEWREVRTDHFRLLIDDTEANARDFGVRLERFDSALRHLYNAPENPDQLLRPITIYALRDNLFEDTCRCFGVLGYYRSQMQGSFIMVEHVPEIDRKARTGGWSSQTLLLHEYSHHFAFFHSPIAYPGWFTEGFAEFNANTSFEPDGSVVIGYPANYRGYALEMGNMPIKRLLDPFHFGPVENGDLFYGRGWLLTHYLMLSPKRRGQLAAYLDALNHGKSSIDAAESAFGDLKKLDDELDAYQKAKLFAPLRIPPDKTAPKVGVTTLPKPEAEMLPLYMSFQNGMEKGMQLGPLLKARGVAKRYPDDATVQEQLAELELTTERLDAADAAADRALQLKPDMVEALVTKGLVAVARAHQAESKDPAVWKAARAWFIKANHADPNAVPPLFYNFTSFTTEGRKPTESAVKGLMRTAVVAPESDRIRIVLAREMLAEGDGAAARALLQPVAFAPHSHNRDDSPRQIIDLIDAGKLDEAKALITGKKIAEYEAELRR